MIFISIKTECQMPHIFYFFLYRENYFLIAFSIIVRQIIIVSANFAQHKFILLLCFTIWSNFLRHITLIIFIKSLRSLRRGGPCTKILTTVDKAYAKTVEFGVPFSLRRYQTPPIILRKFICLKIYEIIFNCLIYKI